MHQNLKRIFAEMTSERDKVFEFTSMVRELAEPGEITRPETYPFEFLELDKPYESYDGSNVRLRYFLRIVITRCVRAQIGP